MNGPGAQPAASAAPSSHVPANRWAVLVLVGVAPLMVVLDVTIVNIALPSAQKALQFSAGDRQWIITAYALTFGSLLLLGGKLGDLFGRKWTFVAGLLGFAGASALGGLAPSFAVLVAARALQGAFGALLAPSALSLLTITFHDSPDRPHAFGIFSAIAASRPAARPSLCASGPPAPAAALPAHCPSSAPPFSRSFCSCPFQGTTPSASPRLRPAGGSCRFPRPPSWWPRCSKRTSCPASVPGQ